MNAETLIGYAEAGFVAVGLLAIILLMVRVFHRSSKRAMDDHANIPFRGEDAPQPRDASDSTRQTNHG